MPARADDGSGRHLNRDIRPGIGPMVGQAFEPDSARTGPTRVRLESLTDLGILAMIFSACRNVSKGLHIGPPTAMRRWLHHHFDGASPSHPPFESINPA